MALEVGTLIQMTRDAPDKGLCKGDVGIINYVSATNKYSVWIYEKSDPQKDIWGEDRLYGEQGDFWLPFEHVKRYEYKPGERVIIVGNSIYKGKFGTVYSYKKGIVEKGKVNLYIDDTIYQNTPKGNKYYTLVESSVIPVNVDNMNVKESNMKLSGYNRVALIECGGVDYHYALYDDNINVNDKVLVSGRLDGAIYIVKDIITEEESKKIREKDIISEVKCKVDLSDYEQRVKNREEAIKLREKMDEEIKKMDELNKYEMYADRNPALKEMLDQLKALGV